jgi:hypothetical protein
MPQTFPRTDLLSEQNAEALPLVLIIIAIATRQHLLFPKKD